jgi:hypothetical protein
MLRTLQVWHLIGLIGLIGLRCGCRVAGQVARCGGFKPLGDARHAVSLMV